MNKWWLRLRLRTSGLQKKVIPTGEYIKKVGQEKAKIEVKRQKAIAREMRDLLLSEKNLLEFFSNQTIIFDVRPHPNGPAIMVYEPRCANGYHADPVVHQTKFQPAFRPRLQQHGHFRFLYQNGKLITINQHAPTFDIVVDEPVFVYRPCRAYTSTTHQWVREAFVFKGVLHATRAG